MATTGADGSKVEIRIKIGSKKYRVELDTKMRHEQVKAIVGLVTGHDNVEFLETEGEALGPHNCFGEDGRLAGKCRAQEHPQWEILAMRTERGGQ